MRLKKEFITYPLDDNVIMVGSGNTSFKGMVKANPTAAFMIECLKDEISEEELVEKLLERYDADRKTIEKDVHSLIEKLRGIEALQ